MGQAMAGQIGIVAMGLVGLLGVVRAWHRRRQVRRHPDMAPATSPADDSAAMVERRMAAYLASRD